MRDARVVCRQPQMTKPRHAWQFRATALQDMTMRTFAAAALLALVAGAFADESPVLEISASHSTANLDQTMRSFGVKAGTGTASR